MFSFYYYFILSLFISMRNELTRYVELKLQTKNPIHIEHSLFFTVLDFFNPLSICWSHAHFLVFLLVSQVFIPCLFEPLYKF